VLLAGSGKSERLAKNLALAPIGKDKEPIADGAAETETQEQTVALLW